MGSRIISAKIPEDLYGRLNQTADRTDRSMSWIIAQALNNYLDNADRLEAHIREALADADAGRTVPQVDISAWADQVLKQALADRRT